jgi:SAM-dependent methyltransferase
MKYDRVREYVRQLEDSRRARQKSTSEPPISTYWQDFSRYTGYVRELSDEQLADIRLHTFHLTSDIYLGYYLGSAADRQESMEEYEWLSERLGGFRLAEGPHGIGFDSRDGLVSVDLRRYLGVLVDLQEASAVRRDACQDVLEIGGGYGGLAAAYVTYNARATYTILDIEEILFFSAVHLMNTLGPERVVLCSVDEPLPASRAPGVVYLVPQSQRELLTDRRFDLAINQQSMQEMRESHVREYCELIKANCRLFYSCNIDQHNNVVVERTGLVTDVNALLASYFPRIVWERRGNHPFVARVARKSRRFAQIYRAALREPALRSSDAYLQRTLYEGVGN